MRIFLPFYRIPTINSDPIKRRRTGASRFTERVVRMYGGSVSVTNAMDGGLIVNLELSLPE
jgi:hypothetical protein